MTSAREALSRFQEVVLSTGTIPLPQDVTNALPHLRRAMDGIDRIYRRQQDERLPELYERVMAAGDEDMKAFFRFFNGPWNTLENHRSVYPGWPDRSKACAFYPADLTRPEWDAFLASCPAELKQTLTSEVTLVRRDGKALTAIPFHEYYRKDLEPVAANLRAAAAVVLNPGLKSYLTLRAESLLDGRYRECDAAWVRLKDTPIEFVCGPYEVYEDQLIGIKASYEASLMVVDRDRAARLHVITENLSALAAVFPLPDGSKASVGGIAPMVVVHQIGAAGEAAQGIRASAFNLPNDPWVRGEVGWKQVMIYNIMEAKFAHCTSRIGERILEAGAAMDFEAYFFHILLHEVSHGLGPAYRANGDKASQCLGRVYTAIEEAKADTGGLCLMLRLGGQHGIPSFEPEGLVRNYVGGLFRSMRFGVHEAHGQANVIEFNWMRRHGVVVPRGNRFGTDPRRAREAADGLLAQLCRIEASASVLEAEAFVKDFGSVGPDIESALAQLEDIPVDIRPVFA
jgi:hypothetical protein